MWMIWLLLPLMATAQTTLVEQGTRLIVEKKYAVADAFFDSILQAAPQNADAWMMKGNVVLNAHADTLYPPSVITETDESPHYTTTGTQQIVIEKTAVKAIEKYWRKALQIAPDHNDIRKGLCNIYSMALMKDSLVEELKRLLQKEKDDGEQVYRLAEYARKLKERDCVNDAMDVYRFLAAQFPAVAGIRCDIASEYYYAGDINKALDWLDSCYAFTSVDETSFLNGAFIYSELGYYDDAQNVLNTYSRIYGRHMDKFFYGLRQFAEQDASYIATLTNFMQLADSGAYYTEVKLSRYLLQLNNTFTIEHYNLLINDSEIPDYYKTLIHYRAMKESATSCVAYVRYGVFQSTKKNFSAAVQLLEPDLNCSYGNEMNEYKQVHFAYALYRMGDVSRALESFHAVRSAENVFYRQAADYFTAKILYGLKRKSDARKIFEMLKSSAPSTKYTHLSEQILNDWQ